MTNHIRDIKDPEHPYSLEELKVITEEAVEVDDQRNYVRYLRLLFFFHLLCFFLDYGMFNFLVSSGLHLLQQWNIAVWQRL